MRTKIGSPSGILNRRILARVALLLAAPALLAAAAPAHAASFFCGTDGSGNPYCSYIGPVRQAYVNKFGAALLYWDASITAADAQAAAETVGIVPPQVNSFFAGIIRLSEDPAHPEWEGSYLYSTVLAAKLAGMEVSVQMRPAWAGYLEIDRVWVRP